jgi:RNA polymerase sigma factor (sigma-70 family)
MATAARTPDAELLLRLRKRDRAAWEELYAEYQPRLRSFGLRLSGSGHDADDLVQETFVRALPRLDRLDPETTDVAAYLFATMRNLFLKQVERGKRQQPFAEVPEPVLPTPIEDDPEHGTLLRSQQDEMRVANARLQPRQRLVLALRELEDRSYAEIGELVGMKENAVAQLIFRARESLRTEMRLVQVDPERLPEECRSFLPLLAAHLDGQLKGARRDETLAHLDGCEHCQAALSDMAEASRRYRTLFPLLLGSDDAKAALDQRLDDARYWGRPPRRLSRRTTRVAAATGLAVVVVGGGAALGVQLARTSERGGETSAGAPPSSAPLIGVTDTSATVTPPPTAGSVTPEETKPTAASPPPPEPVTGPEPPPAVAGPPLATNAPATVAPPTAAAEPKPNSAPAPDPRATPKPVPPPQDAEPPTIVITGAPGPSVGVPSATIGFRASEAGASLSCKLDGAPYAPCKSPVQLAGLAVGSHSFSVRAADEAGNVSAPVSVTWSYTPPDTTPPTATITAAPAATSVDTGARFEFSASEPATFECSLDGAAFASCTSPKANTSLAIGPHAFSVRATDEAGNTSAAVSHSWSVVAPLPDLFVSALAKFSITVSNKGAAAAGRSTLTVTLVGTFVAPALAPGASATFSWSTCRVGTYSAIVDRTQVVVEADERNNVAALVNACP